jgi:hypothetical protein
LFWDGYPCFRDPATLRAALLDTVGEPARAGVLPAAPMQLLEDHRSPEPLVDGREGAH